MHSEDDQTPSSRAVDPIADDGVWAIIDDGCNSCFHGEVWRQNAEVKMKVFGLHPILLHRKATTSVNANALQWMSRTPRPRSPPR